jgi:hypothetical protein
MGDAHQSPGPAAPTADAPVFVIAHGPAGGAAPAPLVQDRFVRAVPETLSARARRAFQAIATAVCPVEAGPEFPDAIARVEGYILAQLPYMNPVIRWAFGPLCRVVDWSPLWRFRGLRPIHALSRERATAELDGMVHSRFALVRNAFYPVKALILAGYYDQPEVHVALDYAPVPFIAERTAFRARLMAGQPAEPGDFLMSLPGPRPAAAAPPVTQQASPPPAGATEEVSR